jgi:hypothetical protein
MKVFFTTTPRFKEEHKVYCDAIYDTITRLGHKHTSDYIKKVSARDFYTFNNEKVPIYYDEILDALRSADVVVFETSIHSIGVGLLLREALDLGKGVVALHMKGNFPFLLGGLKEDRLVIEEYTTDTIKDTLEASFDYLNNQMDTRFNFFITPKHQFYLDWISKNKRVPRAVYLRNLIEKAMEADEEYSG